MKKLISLLFIMLCYSTNANNIIYVSPTKSPLNNGTRENPFSSLNEALETAIELKDSDTIFIQLLPGTYYLKEAIKITQTPNIPIIIQGEEHEKTVLSGSIPFNFVKANNSNYWEANLSSLYPFELKVEQLYVNNTRATRAKTPDEGFFTINSSKETIHYRGNKRFTEYATQQFKTDIKNLHTLKNISPEERNHIITTFYHKWNTTRKYISYISPDSGYIYTEGQGLIPCNPIAKGTQFILENYKSALSKEGEWFLDKNNIMTYIPYQEECITKTTAYLPILSKLLIIKGKKQSPIRNITFRNISFQHSSYIMPLKGDNPSQAAAQVDATIEINFAHNIVFKNCEVKHTGNYAIWFKESCKDCKLEHSYLFDLGAGGVKIGECNPIDKNQLTSNITINNNIIHNIGNVSPAAVGIAIFQSSNNKITHNEIANTFYSGISVGWKWGYGESRSFNNEIAYNHIHHIGWGRLSDMGGIYTLGESPNTHIHHNVIHDIYSYDYGGWGLYTDQGSTGILLENNLVYACKSGGFNQHYGKNNIIRNNIFAFGQYQQLQFGITEPHLSFTLTNNIVLMDCGKILQGPWQKANIQMSNNCFWDLRTDSVIHSQNLLQLRQKKDSNFVYENPSFVNPYKGNFHLKDKKTITKIGFIPFDYQSAGVYGSKSWKEKAHMKPEDIRSFNNLIRTKEKEYSLYYKE